MGGGYHASVLLVVDVGNTNLTLGLVVDGALTGSRRGATPGAPTAGELEGGAARLATPLAAQRPSAPPPIGVGFGTATTFDVVAQDGAYLGGAIAPGLEL